MGRFKLWFVALLSLVSISFLAGCSNDDEPGQGRLSKGDGVEYIKSLTGGEASVAYKCNSLKLYDKSYKGSGKWEEVNLYELDGWAPTAPMSMTIMEGRTWTPLELFDISMGPNPLYMPWMAYCRTTGFDKSLWIAAPVLYDEAENLLTILGHDFSVEGVGKASLTLSICNEYYKSSSDGSGLYPAGQFKEVVEYVKTDLEEQDRDKMMCFDTEQDAYRTMIKMLRDEFGDVFNLNDYLGGSIILDEPMVDLNEIESQLLG